MDSKRIKEKKILTSIAGGNKLTNRKCVICKGFMQAKKQKYCSNACGTKGAHDLYKKRMGNIINK